MNYYAIVKFLYPDIQDNEFFFKDDNGEVSILKWTYQGADKPSMEYLQSQEAAGDLWYAKNQKNKSLNSSCANAITDGFSSSALGSVHTYPSKEDSSAGQFDQNNLNNAATAANAPGLPSDWSTPLWCVDESNLWIFAQHTAAQVHSVMQDFLTTKNNYRAHLSTLSAEVSEATTVDEVNAINW